MWGKGYLYDCVSIASHLCEQRGLSLRKAWQSDKREGRVLCSRPLHVHSCDVTATDRPTRVTQRTHIGQPYLLYTLVNSHASLKGHRGKVNPPLDRVLPTHPSRIHRPLRIHW